MRRLPPIPCRGPTPKSNIQAFPGNLYRSGLGVGMSPAIKKCPQYVYRPGVGTVLVECCIPAYIPPPPAPTVLDGGSPMMSGPLNLNGGSPGMSGNLILNGGRP